MPLSVDEYQVAQSYSFSIESLNNTGGGDGLEVKSTKNFHDLLLNSKPSRGVYTHKIYHMHSKVPGFIQVLMPKGTLEFHEEAWNAYPYCKTVYTNPKFMKENFTVTIESLHVAGGDHLLDNALNLPAEKLQQRQVVHIDIANDRVAPNDYKEDEDPTKVRSTKARRGPLTAHWKTSTKPLMTIYKVVTAEFKWLGLQDRVENYMLKSQQRMFTIFHRKIYCWMDQWYGLTMKDIQLLEERIQKELDLQRNQGELRGYVT